MLFVRLPVQVDPLSGILPSTSVGRRVSGDVGTAATVTPRIGSRAFHLYGVEEGRPGEDCQLDPQQLATEGHEQGHEQGQEQVRKLVLVVDDSDLTRKMLCRMMRAHGYDCEEAEDGLVAVDKVRQTLAHTAGRQYAVVLMDFVMPRMDGPSATKEIRALGYAGPVVGVTGNGQEFDVLKLLDSGADKVFTKPLDMVGFTEFMRQRTAVPAPSPFPDTASVPVPAF